MIVAAQSATSIARTRHPFPSTAVNMCICLLRALTQWHQLPGAEPSYLAPSCSFEPNGQSPPMCFRFVIFFLDFLLGFCIRTFVCVSVSGDRTQCMRDRRSRPTNNSIRMSRSSHRFPLCSPFHFAAFKNWACERRVAQIECHFLVVGAQPRFPILMPSPSGGRNVNAVQYAP